jgi:hypothetical protein
MKTDLSAVSGAMTPITADKASGGSRNPDLSHKDTSGNGFPCPASAAAHVKPGVERVRTR